MAEPLPSRGSVFAIEGLVLLAGAIVGVLLEELVPLWMGLAGAMVLLQTTARRARALPVLAPARLWRSGLTAALVVGLALAIMGRSIPLWIAAAAPLALGEVGALYATEVPWSRRMAGWRPVFRASTRLFGAVGAVALVSGGIYVGMAQGSAAALVLGLGLLPLLMRAPGSIVVEGQSVPSERMRCPRCNVPSDWPLEGPGHCPACGLIKRA